MGEPPATEPIQGEDTAPPEKKEEKEKEGKAMKKKPKISYDVCLANRDQKARHMYCDKTYGFDPTASENCKVDYCGTCCDGLVDAMHKVHRFQCKKECNGASSVSDVVLPYASCLDSPRADKSVFSYCKTSFQNRRQELECNQGFCDMCCVLIVKSNKLDIADSVVNQCHADCMTKYGLQEEGAVVMSSDALENMDIRKYVEAVVKVKTEPNKSQ